MRSALTVHTSILVAVLFVFESIHAQQKPLYTYQQLSNVAYAKQKDSLKKTWVCPTVFSDKDAQKKYKDVWDSRVAFITDAIENKNYIYEKELYDYVGGIIQDIAAANPSLIPHQPLLLIDRSSSVNAYSYGGNIIAVNVGLILFSNCREELALAIAHELSHNILNHADRAIKERIEWLTSDEYKKSLNAVLDSKYERFSQLKKIIENYSFTRSKHNRYHESDADSLAIILLNNSKIGFDAKFFLHLDSSDLRYKTPLQKPVEQYFTTYGLPFEDWWTQRKGKGLSTHNYNFQDTTGVEDSIKTHPDCIVRYEKTASRSSTHMQYTAIPASLKETADRIMIWNQFDNMSLSACLYNVLLAKDRGVTDEWYDFMLHNVIAGLYYADLNLMRFTAIGITQKEYISKNFYELQNMLEQMPKDKLQAYYKDLQSTSFWGKMPADAKGLKLLMSRLTTGQKDDKEHEVAAKDFMNSYNESMYCEFADHFRKK